MKPNEIRGHLLLKNVRSSDVARKIGVSDAAVSQVISGTAVSARISAEIARIIGKPVSEIWPGRAA